MPRSLLRFFLPRASRPLWLPALLAIVVALFSMWCANGIIQNLLRPQADPTSAEGLGLVVDLGCLDLTALGLVLAITLLVWLSPCWPGTSAVGVRNAAAAERWPYLAVCRRCRGVFDTRITEGGCLPFAALPAYRGPIPVPALTLPLVAPPPRRPPDTLFATKPALGQQILQRARAAGVPARWVVADSFYETPDLCAWLEQQDLWYVLGVPTTQPIWTAGQQVTAALIADLPAEVTRMVASPGCTGNASPSSSSTGPKPWCRTAT